MEEGGRVGCLFTYSTSALSLVPWPLKEHQGPDSGTCVSLNTGLQRAGIHPWTNRRISSSPSVPDIQPHRLPNYWTEDDIIYKKFQVYLCEFIFHLHHIPPEIFEKHLAWECLSSEHLNQRLHEGATCFQLDLKEAGICHCLHNPQFWVFEKVFRTSLAKGRTFILPSPSVLTSPLKTSVSECRHCPRKTLPFPDQVTPVPETPSWLNSKVESGAWQG